MISYQEQARGSMLEAAMRLSASNGRTVVKEVIAKSLKDEVRSYISAPHRRIDAPQYTLKFEDVPQENRSTFKIGSHTPYDGGVSLEITFNETPGRTAVGARLVFATGNNQEDHDYHSQHGQLTRSHDITRILRVMRSRDPKEIEALLRDSHEILNPDFDKWSDERRGFINAMAIIGTDEHAKNVFGWYVDSD